MHEEAPTHEPEDAAQMPGDERADSQQFWDRARSSAFELLKFGVGLSTAIVAVLYAALMQSAGQSRAERIFVGVAMAFMVAAVLAALAGWAADAFSYSAWARSVDDTTADGAARWIARRDLHQRNRRWALCSAGAAFTVGALATGVYVIMRALTGP